MNNSKKLTILFGVFLICVFSLFLLFKALTANKVDPEYLKALEVFKEEELYGIKNSETGETVVKAVYQEIGDITSDNIIKVKQDDKYGCINSKGKVIIPIAYQELGNLSDKLMYAKYEDKYGYINTKGETAIGFNYDEASDFFNGLAKVKTENLSGYINTSGSGVLGGITYTEIDDTDNEFIIMKNSSDMYGVLNLNSKDWVLDFDYTFLKRIENTTDFFACAKKDEDGKTEKYALISKGLEKTLDFEYQFIDTVLYADKVIIKQNDKYFFTDLQGNTNEDDISLDYIEKISGGTEYFAKKNNKSGIVYFDGDELLQVTGFVFDDIKSLSSSKSAVKQNNYWFVVENKTGFVVDSSTGKAISDKQSEPDEDDMYSSIGEIGEKRTFVSRAGKTGLLNPNGKLLINVEYNSINIEKEIILVSKDGLMGCFDLDAKLITECQYESIDKEYYFDRLRVMKDKKYGYIDRDGEEVIPVQYNTAEIFVENKAGEITAEVGDENNKYFNINVDGEKV